MEQLTNDVFLALSSALLTFSMCERFLVNFSRVSAQKPLPAKTHKQQIQANQMAFPPIYCVERFLEYWFQLNAVAGRNPRDFRH